MKKLFNIFFLMKKRMNSKSQIFQYLPSSLWFLFLLPFNSHLSYRSQKTLSKLSSNWWEFFGLFFNVRLKFCEQFSLKISKINLIPEFSFENRWVSFSIKETLQRFWKEEGSPRSALLSFFKKVDTVTSDICQKWALGWREYPKSKFCWLSTSTASFPFHFLASLRHFFTKFLLWKILLIWIKKLLIEFLSFFHEMKKNIFGFFCFRPTSSSKDGYFFPKEDSLNILKGSKFSVLDFKYLKIISLPKKPWWPWVDFCSSIFFHPENILRLLKEDKWIILKHKIAVQVHFSPLKHLGRQQDFCKKII